MSAMHRIADSESQTRTHFWHFFGQEASVCVYCVPCQARHALRWYPLTHIGQQRCTHVGVMARYAFILTSGGKTGLERKMERSISC